MRFTIHSRYRGQTDGQRSYDSNTALRSKNTTTPLLMGVCL